MPDGVLSRHLRRAAGQCWQAMLPAVRGAQLLVRLPCTPPNAFESLMRGRGRRVTQALHTCPGNGKGRRLRPALRLGPCSVHGCIRMQLWGRQATRRLQEALCVL